MIVSHVTSLEKKSTELRTEKRRNIELQAQLSEANCLYQDLSIRCQTEFESVHQQTVSFQQITMELQQ